MKRTISISVMLFSIFIFSKVAGAALEEYSLQKIEEGYESDIKTETVEIVKIPKGYHEGLFFDGTNMWVNNGEKIDTWIIDVSSGDVVDEIKPVGTFTEGITKTNDGKYWVTDWDSKELILAGINNSVMEPEKRIYMGPAHPTGVVLAGEDL